MSPDAEQEIRDRFQTEARINSKLGHPNIVQCINFGSTSGGLPYLEMEYLAGPSLDTLLSRSQNTIPPPVALAISIGILEALSYAHTVRYTLYGRAHGGLVHRDLKPANIVINADGNPKLMDFGIARPLDCSLHTVAGTVPGTVAYMSPEACAGGEVDFRSDIYQFGLCLYELLCGLPAFPQLDLSSLLSSKTSNAYKPLDQLAPALGKPILTIVQRCMQLHPDARYDSAHACLLDVRAQYLRLYPSEPPHRCILAYLEGQPIITAQRLKRPVKAVLYRLTTTTAAMAILALIIIAAVIYTPTAVLRLRALANHSLAPTPPTNLDSASFSSLAPQPTPPSTNKRPLTKAPSSQAKTNSSLLVKNEKNIPLHSATRTSNQTKVALKSESNQDDALFYIEKGQELYKANNIYEALSCFQNALKLPSRQPRQQIVHSGVYWSAKCMTALYAQNSVPKSNFIVSWRAVINSFPATAPEHAEALSHLQEIME
jgi:serine/threonine protein kinase